jgi:hypothetical protein
MDPNTFLMNVYCIVDDFLQGRQVRQRGSQPQVSDSEVLTLEIVGSCLGVTTDKGLYTFFRDQ